MGVTLTALTPIGRVVNDSLKVELVGIGEDFEAEAAEVDRLVASGSAELADGKAKRARRGSTADEAPAGDAPDGGE